MIRVLLVDDDALVRAGLRMILGGAPDVEVIGEAGDGQDAVDQARAATPDVVLMDIRMPRMDGIAATEQLVTTYGDQVRVIVLTTFDADDMVVRAVRVGASGFLLKDTPPERLVAAVRAVADGEPILSPSITASLMARLGSAGDDGRATRARERLTVLTDREHEVALAVGRGLSNAEISKTLYMSVPTVKAHVSRLLTKLDASNRVQIAITVHDADLL
ncbi:response regulator transcription factor [Luteipulveratus mongoliensis]|uniref:LuxR family transcriptional regulator n=1 Tax=Luteipulveratus mongoliensis TaxID=571913 RepID=A0A0K1JQN5_9MICO|nr:response regulator transcription factor [Luteipulveratus mongoliensis]AKU19034.1 LuxR family transcriptional regulator [Luteipulveratus mongoliensis]